MTVDLSKPFVINEWPRSGKGRRGPRATYEFVLDGQIHVLPKPDRYVDMNSFRRALIGRANFRGYKMETCTDEQYPGALVVRVTGRVE